MPYSPVLVKKDPFTHTVSFYTKEDQLISLIVNYFKKGLTHNESCIMIATKEHRNKVFTELTEFGFDMRSAEISGRFRSLDAENTLSHIMINGMPDHTSFKEVIGSLIPYIQNTSIRAYGGMVALLCAEGNTKGAIELEKLWNTLGETRHFDLLCTYHEHSCIASVHEDIRALHHHSTFQKNTVHAKTLV